MDSVTPASVVAVFLRANREVLAVSRKGNLTDIGLPGGKIEPGEAPEDAVRREVHEEVGITIKHMSKCYERIDPVDGNVAWCYLVHTWEGTPRPRESNTSVLWCAPDKMLEPHCTFREYNRGLFEHLSLSGKPPKMTHAQWRVLRNLHTGRTSYDGLRGMGQFGGLTVTLWSMRKRGWIDAKEELTDAGRAAYLGTKSWA